MVLYNTREVPIHVVSVCPIYLPNVNFINEIVCLYHFYYKYDNFIKYNEFKMAKLIL